jgi:serine/threonine protein kinase
MGRSPDRHQRVRALFDELLLLEPSARTAYLKIACRDDYRLLSDVQRLLAAHSNAGSFLEHSPVGAFTADVDHTGTFPNTERFSFRSRLGSGGMGVVYEAYDRLRQEHVALKTLRYFTASDLYRLKCEFRSLIGLVHPNLACLYELFVDNGQGFFTMELVEGTNFVEYINGACHGPEFESRFVSTARQLVDGVIALHRNGMLHRDIKPSNILVTPGGRVVILDFGLVTEKHRGGSTDVAAGTPAYIAPEVAAGAPASEASDWYAVGVTLYEALTGVLPVAGSASEVLLRKQTEKPPAPMELVSDVPEPLNAMCMGLICGEPARRLNGAAVLDALDRPIALSHQAGTPPYATSFVGRRQQLRVLDNAFDTVVDGRIASVCVYGPSGIGKTALVGRFLDNVRTRSDVIVLSGRCYENESVPYKALDGVVDALSRHLCRFATGCVARLLPRDLTALTQVFPVLRQVEAFNACRQEWPDSVDPFALRVRAFAALRDLFHRVAAEHRLIVSIDDLQWTDPDSIVLLEELLRLPDAPVMLTVLTFRSEETATKPFLQKIIERAQQRPWWSLLLGPMTEAESDVLIRELPKRGTELTDERRRHIAREAGGSPFVLEQLTWSAGITQWASEPPTLTCMLDARLESLSPHARQFLQVLALCGRPMSPDVLYEACGIVRERQSLVVTLRSLRLIRSSGSQAWIEPYHDRIREALCAGIPPDAARSIHRLMAQVLTGRGSVDCEVLFEHFHGAGDAENATLQAVLSADRATTALAFDRAALFYRHALALAPASTSRQAWQESLAGALANAGRPLEAAEAYLAAAMEADRARQVELRRRSAEQFLIGGHIDRGLDLISQVLASLGLRAPTSPRGALWSLLWWRVRLRWRGLEFTTRNEKDIYPDMILKIDTLWSAASGLALVDVISAMAFSVHNLHLALDAGDSWRIARAMAFELVARGAYPTGRRLSVRLVAKSEALAKSTGHPQAMAMTFLADGLVASARGEWKRALTQSERAIEILRDQCVGLTWETNIAQNLIIWALMYLGELAEVSRRVPELLATARSRGNLYLATELCTRSNYVWLAADDPDGGEREAMESIASWSQKGFHRQHYSALLARVQTALYRGDAQGAWRLLKEHESRLRYSLITKVQVFRVETHYLWGRAALAMAATEPQPEFFLSRARIAARRIARERMPWSNPIALLLDAGAATLEGHQAQACGYLRHAAEGFDRADMQLYAAVARSRLGIIEGSKLREQAEAWMTAQAIRNPARLSAMLAPGFADPAGT